MGLTFIMQLVGSLIIVMILGKQVTTSAVQNLKDIKVNTQIIQTEKAIYEAICRYIITEQSNPATITDLVNKNYLPANLNNNGFGGVYTFTINETKGTVTISTDISDATVRTMLINSYKNTFKPVQGTGNTVNTTFVFPTAIMHGNGQFSKSIPIQSTTPALTNKYWYDTSGTNVVLKVSDGTTWKSIDSGPTNSIGSTIATSSGTLPTTGVTTGDIKYVYDSATNGFQQYTYYNGGWVVSSSIGGGTSTISNTIKLVAGVRQWSDGTYATSCLKYIKSDVEGYDYRGDIGDGTYKIDIDGTGGVAPINVYCDQTTDGGGWTMVFYSNKDNVPRTSIDNQDWGTSPNVNFSILWSMKDQKRNGLYEFYIYDSSTIQRNIIFTQTNAYYENPVGNSFTKKSGNFYYSTATNGSTWYGLALGNYGNTTFQNNCSLAMASEGSSWTYCLQDQRAGSYGTGPWFYDGAYDTNSQQWVKIFQR